MIPTLTVGLQDERGRDLFGGSLWLDGKPVAVDGSSLEVDPGVHELTAQSEGSRQARELTVEQNTNRRIELVLHQPIRLAACSTPTATSAARAQPSAPSPQVTQAAGAAAQRSPLPAYALAGVAVLGAISFAILALSGHSEQRHRRLQAGV